MTDQISQDWIEKVQDALIKSQQLPFSEDGPPFPWEKASIALETALEITGLKISTHSSHWKTEEEVLSGMGNEPLIFNIELSPIPGSVQWIMSSEDITKLSSYCLTSDQKSEGFSDHKLQEGFYHFLLLEAIQGIDQLKAFKDGTLRLIPGTIASKEEVLCIDIGIVFSSKTIYGRLACPQSFVSAFKAHKSLQNTSLSEETTKQLEISLHVETGNVALTREEWENVMPGDFIILDRCSYDPESEKGSVTLMLGETSLLRGRIRPEGIKILEYAFYFEDKQSSDTTPSEEEDFDEEPLSLEDDLLLEDSVEEEIKTTITSEEAPLTLSIEMGVIRMTIGKLLELKPDALLELSIHPEQGVNATLNKRQVAKGELIKLGQIVGLRLLDIEK